MNALTPLSFASAYRQLRPAEKAFVDAAVSDMEREAVRANERISSALHRPVPAHIAAQADGMLDRPLVRAAIVERINDIAADNELTPHRVVKEIMAMSFASIGDYMHVGADGQPYFDFSKCTPEQLSAVQSIEIEEGLRTRKFKFKLHDKQNALKMLGEYMGLLRPDNAYWRADQPAMVDGGTLTADSSDQDAADAYSRMINNG